MQDGVDVSHNPVEVMEDFLVRVENNPVTLCLQDPRSLLITRTIRLGRVLRSVDLNHKLLPVRSEIERVTTKRDLSSQVKAHLAKAL